MSHLCELYSVQILMSFSVWFFVALAKQQSNKTFFFEKAILDDLVVSLLICCLCTPLLCVISNVELKAIPLLVSCVGLGIMCLISRVRFCYKCLYFFRDSKRHFGSMYRYYLLIILLLFWRWKWIQTSDIVQINTVSK